MEAVTAATYVPRAPRVQLPEYGPAAAASQVVLVAPAPYVTVALASSITGFTDKAIRRKVEDGIWAEKEVWRRAPDGSILISMEGYRKWVEQAPASRSAKRASA